MREKSGIAAYFDNAWKAAYSTFEGLAVTFSWMFRRPITIQYPDKIDKPTQETLPDGYRGILEVDLDRCTGCMLCSKTCPIDCIRVKIEKNEETKERFITSFDIDIGKCMYCGLCTENCKFGAIHHSKEFEATACKRSDLVIHFTDQPRPVAKPKKDREPVDKPLGQVVRKKLKVCFEDKEGK
ncbi:MAG: 4Fe-4S dicluster domain-containing protein [Deltaproteobacteria bacterium]|nr:4Fe-4S dicluster domain-containing protein [Deltaproteobacteria bacterium]